MAPEFMSFSFAKGIVERAIQDFYAMSIKGEIF
jgi:hypothetical protein